MIGYFHPPAQQHRHLLLDRSTPTLLRLRNRDPRLARPSTGVHLGHDQPVLVEPPVQRWLVEGSINDRIVDHLACHDARSPRSPGMNPGTLYKRRCRTVAAQKPEIGYLSEFKVDPSLTLRDEPWLVDGSARPGRRSGRRWQPHPGRSAAAARAGPRRSLAWVASPMIRSVNAASGGAAAPAPSLDGRYRSCRVVARLSALQQPGEHVVGGGGPEVAVAAPGPDLLDECSDQPEGLLDWA